MPSDASVALVVGFDDEEGGTFVVEAWAKAQAAFSASSAATRSASWEPRGRGGRRSVVLASQE
jgi:hypothetical protein